MRGFSWANAATDSMANTVVVKSKFFMIVELMALLRACCPVNYAGNIKFAVSALVSNNSIMGRSPLIAEGTPDLKKYKNRLLLQKGKQPLNLLDGYGREVGNANLGVFEFAVSAAHNHSRLFGRGQHVGRV